MLCIRVELHHLHVYTFSGFIVYSCCRVKKNIHIDLSCLQLSHRWIRCSVRNQKATAKARGVVLAPSTVNNVIN